MSRGGVAASTALCAVSAMLLAGCVTARPVPKPLSNAEVSQIIDQSNAYLWSQSFPGSTGIDRPDVGVIALVDRDHWAITIAGCLREAGFGFARATADGGLQMDFVVDQDAYGVSYYFCNAEYPRDPRTNGYLSAEQRAYAYDYLTGTLVPCLELQGYRVTAAPARDAFLASPFTAHGWNPYAGIAPADDDWSLIDYRCPPLPPEFGAYHD